MDLLQVRDRLLRRTKVRLRDDLEQRRAGPVEVDAAGADQPLVQRLARVFLQMRTRDTDRLPRPVVQDDFQRSVLDDRPLVLADLVTLGQVGIEVVLAREHGPRGDLGAGGESELHGHAHRFGIQHRQHAGIAEVHEVRLRVRCRAVGGRAAGKDLRASRELGVNLKPDDDFPLGFLRHVSSSGVRRRHAHVPVGLALIGVRSRQHPALGEMRSDQLQADR